MTDWASVRQELQDAGYLGFEFKRGETPVPGLSGEWMAADITSEEGLKRERSYKKSVGGVLAAEEA